MKRFLLTCLCLTSIFAYAQHIPQKPNYEEINTLITQEGDNNYTTLLSRLQLNDTTLSPQHFYVLYYGQSLQKKYSPYSLDNQYLFELLEHKKYDDFIRSATVYLKDYPFDLRIREYLIQLLHEKTR